MIEALGGWLRQVVAAVLLAALIDLLLPNRTMQRYVRLVAGLFILLTLAGPLLSWIQGDMDAKLAAGIEWAERGPADGEDGEDGGQLEAIMAEAKRIGADRDEQAAELAVTGLEAQIKAVVEQEEGMAVKAVEVKAAPSADGTLAVEAVKIRLAGPGTAAAAEGGEPVAEVEPVAPVVVDIDIGTDADNGKESERAEPAAAQTGAQPTDDGLEGRIAAVVAGRFGIGTSKVEVDRASDG